MHIDDFIPESPEFPASDLEGLPYEDVTRITHRNAMRFFTLDPCAHIMSKDAPVKTLRARAGDVDLGFKSSARLKKEGSDTVSVMCLASTLAPFA
jgi:hypothetical protein